MSEQTKTCDSCDTVTPADEIKFDRCATCRGCDTCDGTGVVFRPWTSTTVDHKVREEVHIEKCDSCDMYETNDRAAQAVASTWEESNRDTY
jgi:hypothetical protein